MRALLNGSFVELRTGISLEIFPAEPIEFPDSNAIEIVSSPSGEGATLEDRTLRVTDVGRYHLRLTSERSGERSDLYLVCCEPALLPFIEPQLRSLGHGGDDRATAERARLICRSLAQEPWFSGRIDDTTAHPSRSIASRGA